MRFKQWLEDLTTGALGVEPQSATRNDGMPVGSRWSCKNGSDKVPPDEADGAEKTPEQTFGMPRGTEKNAKDRRTQWLDKTKRTSVPMITKNTDVVY